MTTETKPKPAKKPRATAAEMLDAMVAPIVAGLEKAIADAEAGKPVEGWLKPWRVAGAGSFGRSVSMKNSTIGRSYTGWNAVYTAFMAAEAGWDCPLWGTFKQWADIGGNIRAKSKGLRIIHPIFRKKKETDKTGKETERSILTGFRQMNIFNLAQVKFLDKTGKKDATGKPVELEPADALPSELVKFLPKPIEPGAEFNPIEAAETLFRQYADAPKLTIGGDVAAYNPTMDAIRMPKPENFDKPEAYYHTLFHEAAHSTGHESRMNRLMPNFRFGDHGYSCEELVAEMAAEMLTGFCGLETDTKNTIAYLKNWHGKVKADPTIIYHASGAAVKAAQWVIGERAELKKAKKPGITGQKAAEAA